MEKIGQIDIDKELLEFYEKTVQDKRDKINFMLFKLRLLSNPSLEESYKKYIPQEILNEMNRFYNSEWVIQQKSVEEKMREERFEKLKGEAFIKVLEERDQQELFSLFIRLLEDSIGLDEQKRYEQDWQEKGFGVLHPIVPSEQEICCDVINEVAHKIVRDSTNEDLDALTKIISSRAINFGVKLPNESSEEHVERILSNYIFQETEFEVEGTKLGEFYCTSGLYECGIQFLEDLIGYYYGLRGITRSIENMYGHPRDEAIGDSPEISSLIKEYPKNDFLNILKLKNVDKESIKKMEDFIKSIKTGRLNVQLVNQFIEIEFMLRELIRKIMTLQRPGDWLKQSVSTEMYNGCMAKLRADKRRGSDDPSEYLDLGQCLQIISDDWNFFKTIFIDCSYGFLSKSDFVVALDFIKSYRNKIHGSSYISKYGDIERLRIYLEKVNNCIKNFFKE